MTTLALPILSAFALAVQGSGQILLTASYYTTVSLRDGVMEGWGSLSDPAFDNGASNNRLVPMVLSSLSPSDEDDDFVIKELIAGRFQYCALSEGGNARCWGNSNYYGQLGTGNTDYYGDETNFGKDIDLGSDFVVESGACGYAFCCLLSTGNGLKCFGYGAHGQLGYEDNINRGDVHQEMGEYLPFVDLGSGFSAIEVAAGFLHSCALSQDKRVKCWGWNGYGQLGQGHTVQSVGYRINEMGNYLAAINFGSHVPERSLRCGTMHCCIVTQDNDLLCWGYNGYGELGIGHTSNIGDQSGDMGNALVTAKLGDDFILDDYQMGCRHTCVLSTSGRVKCFGANFYGTLGYGSTTQMGTASSTIGNNLPYVDLGTNFVVATLGSAGDGYHQCAVSTEEEVKCWGMGSFGQLGIGTTTNMGDAAGEMGDALPTVDLSTMAPTTAAPTTLEPTVSPTTICSSKDGLLIEDVLGCSPSFSNHESRIIALEDSNNSSFALLANVRDLLDVRLTRIEKEDDDDAPTVPVWFVEAMYALMALNVVLVVVLVVMAMKRRQPVAYSKVMAYDSECAKLSEVVGQ